MGLSILKKGKCQRCHAGQLEMRRQVWHSSVRAYQQVAPWRCCYMRVVGSHICRSRVTVAHDAKLKSSAPACTITLRMNNFVETSAA